MAQRAVQALHLDDALAAAATTSAGASAADSTSVQVLQWTLMALPYLLRVLFFLANAFFTAQMWRWYLKALSLGPTPVCQIINTGMNFAVSAFVGLVVFGEQVTLTWACGALFVVLGLAIIVTDPHVSQLS